LKNLIFILLLFVFPFQSFAQYEKYLEKDPEPTTSREAGAALSVIETGSGIGGFYYLPVKGFMHVGITGTAFMLRDKSQIDIYDPYTGYPITLGKKNNAYLIDMMLTLKKRLFPREIDDTLRPFLAVGVGAVYGMNFPENKNIKDEFSLAATGAAAAGVDVALNSGIMIGLRLQYRYMKFGRIIGERQDHSTVDVRIEIGKMFN